MSQKIQHKNWSNKTVECTHPLCHQSVECRKSTMGKKLNYSTEKFYKITHCRFSAFCHGPTYLATSHVSWHSPLGRLLSADNRPNWTFPELLDIHCFFTMMSIFLPSPDVICRVTFHYAMNLVIEGFWPVRDKSATSWWLFGSKAGHEHVSGNIMPCKSAIGSWPVA